MDIYLTTTPIKSEAAALSNGIKDFNSATIPNLEKVEDEIKFTVFAKSDNDQIIGGLRALCYWNTMHIELLWLDDKYRGQGIGLKLLKEAESYAIENDYENAFVETTSWQAKPFYEKNGYKHITTLNNRPKGHSSHYLVKQLIIYNNEHNHIT